MFPFVEDDNRWIEATSYDDPWIGETTHWSFIEREIIGELIELVIMAAGKIGVQMYVRLAMPQNKGEFPFISVTTDQIDKMNIHHVQRIADAICRLVRPARYRFGMPRPATEPVSIFMERFANEGFTAHQRIASWSALERVAEELGRTEEGIQAAIDILKEEDPAEPLLRTA